MRQFSLVRWSVTRGQWRAVRLVMLVVGVLGAMGGGRGVAAEGESLYGRRILTADALRPELKAGVDDLRVFLGRLTKQDFIAMPTPATADVAALAGIRIRRADAADVPASTRRQLPDGNKEAFVIDPEAAGRLWLVSHSDTGLCHAIAEYLEQLGCRFYFPSEKWTIVPVRDDIRVPKSIVRQPAFRSRAFAGSGGFGGVLAVDPQRTLEARWRDWQRRNRFGGEFQVSGHTGEAFNTKYRKELEAHPEWRAMLNGERVPWSLTAKFCAGNDEVVRLYIKDRLAAFELARKSDPESPRAWAVSVEPADGGGHCTAPESLALGSVSDRVFHVANQVAKALAKAHPDGRVSLFAYHEHAPVPSIPLEPNVYVQVIPYAFQRTGLSPDELLTAWSKKVSRMGVYDYWSIPDWSHDLPTLDPLVFAPDRLRGWHARKVDSFLCESTFSSGAIGPVWYFGSRLAWDPKTDVEALFESFVADCFGPAAEPMRRMLRRWSNGYYSTSHELALSFRDLDEAYRLAEGNTSVTARVADYGRYVEYLRRYFEYQQSLRIPEERAVAADRLMRYLWRIYDSSMIHAFRLSQLLARDERVAGRMRLTEEFEWHNREAPVWKTIVPLTDVEVRALVSQGVTDHTPQGFTPRRYRGALTRVPQSALPRESPKTGTGTGEFTPDFALHNSVTLDVVTDRANVPFVARVASEQTLRVLVIAADGTRILERAFATPNWKTEATPVETTLPAAGRYRVEIVSQKKPFRFAVRNDVVFSMAGWWNSQGAPTPRLYFYVPVDVERVAIHTNYIAAGPPRFFDADGSEVKPQLVDKGHLMLLPIPEPQRGRVWSLDRAKCPIGALDMLNTPASFAFRPESLLVPADALPAASR